MEDNDSDSPENKIHANESKREHITGSTNIKLEKQNTTNTGKYRATEFMLHNRKKTVAKDTHFSNCRLGVLHLNVYQKSKDF